MNTTTLNTILSNHRNRPGALLPILHEIQDTFGHVPADAVPLIARELNLSRAEVHGVITYYHHFRQHPAGQHVIRICRAEACQAVGSEALLEHAQSRLGCGLHETTADGCITLEPVFCLGQCAIGPAVMIDENELRGRVTAANFDTIADALRGKK